MSTVPAPLAGCWIDLLRPVTTAEKEAWQFYLALHSTHWRAARHMFRRACQGEEPGANLLQFVSATGLHDAAVVVHLEEVLRDLSREGSQSG